MNYKNTFNMKYLLFILTMFLTPAIWSQGLITKELEKDIASGLFPKEIQSILSGKANAMKSEPIAVGKSDRFVMYMGDRVLYLKKDKKVFQTVIETSKKQKLNLREFANYYGIDQYKNIAFITMFPDGPEGFISDSTGRNINIGKSEGVHKLVELEPKPFECEELFTPGQTFESFRQSNKMRPMAIETSGITMTAHCVNWYWECDYNMFQTLGTTEKVIEWATVVSNEVKFLDANDGISFNLHTIKVWNTVSPYTGPASGNFLGQFMGQITAMKQGCDVHHLISFAGLGGIAYVQSICMAPFMGASYTTAFSGVYSSYNLGVVYSWTVECIWHEEGHSYGSAHTHDRCWGINHNQQIDGCGDAAGYSSAPGSPYIPLDSTIAHGGGTGMSYCHLTRVGINFNLGFGPEPSALMRNNIDHNAPCLGTCGTPPPPPPPPVCPAQPAGISGNINVPQKSTQTYSISPVLNATKYNWVLPSTWTGTSNTTSITAVVGLSGTVSVQAINDCGSSSFQNLSVNTFIVPPPPIDTNSCFKIDTCPNPFKWVVIDSVQKRKTDLKVCWHGSLQNGSTGATNVKYHYCIDGVIQSWSTSIQTPSLTKFKAGQTVEVFAYMDSNDGKCRIASKLKFVYDPNKTVYKR